MVLLLATTAAAQPLEPGDRVLFLGDDLTQQMFYSRAAATCLMALQPAAGLRFFNGGRDGATAGDAVTWSVPLLERVRPTVVVVCFGLNDAVTREADAFELELSNLVATVRQCETVRDVIVMSPPALPRVTGEKLADFTAICRRVARTEQARYVDLHTPTARLYRDADRDRLKELTLGDRLPGEPAHVVIASHLLAAMGVTGEAATGVHWSPLTPVQMGKVRPDLAWRDTAPPALADAAASRRLYVLLTVCDELFFRLWRLETGEQAALQRQWAEAWAAAERQATTLTLPPPPESLESPPPSPPPAGAP